MILGHLTQGRRRVGPLWLGLGFPLAGIVLSLLCAGCGGGGNGLVSHEMRDFPPLESPDRGDTGPAVMAPGEAGQAPIPGIIPPGTDPTTPTELESTDSYRLGVGDELSIVVLGQAEFTRSGLKVLPDGTIATPGAGTVYALGKTVPEISAEIETRLARYLRFPDVEVIVAQYGEHVVYVFGEVEIPGDTQFRKGMSVLQAVAQAGGFVSTGKRSSVVLLRRISEEEAEYYKIDLDDPLKGRGVENDLLLQPYDVIYVPKTFIANVNVFVNQWVRQSIAPFDLYLAGWDAFNITKDRIIVRTAF